MKKNKRYLRYALVREMLETPISSVADVSLYGKSGEVLPELVGE